MKSIMKKEQKEATAELSKFFSASHILSDHKDGLILEFDRGLGALTDKKGFYHQRKEAFEAKYGADFAKDYAPYSKARHTFHQLIEKLSPQALENGKVAYVTIPYHGENLLHGLDNKAVWISNDLLKELVNNGVSFGSKSKDALMNQFVNGPHPHRKNQREKEFAKIVVQSHVDRLYPSKDKDALYTTVQSVHLAQEPDNLTSPQLPKDYYTVPINQALWTLLDRQKYGDRNQSPVYPDGSNMYRQQGDDDDAPTLLYLKKPAIDDLIAQGIDFSAKKKELSEVGIELSAVGRQVRADVRKTAR